MSAKENCDVQRKIHALFSDNRFEEALALTTPDVVVEMVALGQIYKGHVGFREFMQSFKAAFPDIRIEHRHQVADDTRAVAEFTAVGTHTGPLATPNGAIAATGRKVTFTVCEVWDFKGGKLAGIRNYQDMGSVLRQLGVA